MSTKAWWELLREIANEIARRSLVGQRPSDPWITVIEACRKAGIETDPEACARIIPPEED